MKHFDIKYDIITNYSLCFKIFNYTIRTVNMKTVIIEILVDPEKLLVFATILPSSASSAAAVSFNEASLLPTSIASMASMTSMASSLLSSS